MKWVIWVAGALAAICGTGVDAQTPTTPQVLFTFNGPGVYGTPSAIVEVSPGNFMGIASNGGAQIFSITSAGSFQSTYVFAGNGLAASGLTPALNGQVYGSAEQLGDSPNFSELFSVALN
jgi:hypothetical protein